MGTRLRRTETWRHHHLAASLPVTKAPPTTTTTTAKTTRVKCGLGWKGSYKETEHPSPLSNWKHLKKVNHRHWSEKEKKKNRKKNKKQRKKSNRNDYLKRKQELHLAWGVHRAVCSLFWSRAVASSSQGSWEAVGQTVFFSIYTKKRGEIRKNTKW